MLVRLPSKAMSDTVTVGPGFDTFLANVWDKKKGKNVEVPVKDFWRYADHYVKVLPGTNLCDFFNCLGHSFTGFKGVDELRRYCRCDFTLLLLDIAKEPSRPIEKDILFLEVNPGIEIANYDDDEKTPTMSIFWGFHGWGIWPKEGLTSGEKDVYGGYAVELTPLSQLKHLELKIKEEVEIGTQTFNPKFKYKKLLTVRMQPTFVEFVRAILWELSFFGNPQNRDKFAAKLEKTTKDLASGKLKTYPWSEMQKRIEKKLKAGKNSGKKA